MNDVKAHIRNMQPSDSTVVKALMKTFYASNAVHSNGSNAVFEADFNACVSDSPYLEGFVFEADKQIIGYSMIAKSFATEFGKPCIWIEDLYFMPEYRNKGIGNLFFEFLFSSYPDHVFRLEAELDNKNAIHLYQKKGFEILPYVELKR